MNLPTKSGSRVIPQCPETCWSSVGNGNDPRDSLKENHRGWFIRVISSFPAENQEAKQASDSAFLVLEVFL